MSKETFQKFIFASIVFSMIVVLNISTNAADGDLDVTFDTDGIAIYDFDGAPSATDNDNVFDVAVQPDGKVVLVGRAYVTSSNRALAVLRFNANGTVDTTFGTNGRILNDYSADGDEFWGVAIQPDGKILAAGYVNNTRTRIVIRYNPNGTTDTTFATDGVFTAPLAFQNNTVTQDNAKVILQPDGKIIVTGTYKAEAGADRFGVYRLNSNGTLDTSFGDGGLATARFTAASPNFGDRPFGVALQTDGKIVAAGYADSDDVAVARWNTDGTLDTTFDGDGKVSTDFGATDASAWSMTIQPDGKILTGGRVNINDSDVLLVRYNTDGSLDTTFSGDGISTANFGASDHAYRIFVRGDKIITVGDSLTGLISDFLITRFNMDGSLDTSFGTNGGVKTNINSNDFTYSAAFAPDGKLVIGGYTQYLDLRGQDFVAARYNFANAVPRKAPADFDGDGKSDISIYRSISGGNSQWWLKNSSTNNLRTVAWGLSTDVPTPADFDGDGKTDIAIWRPAPATQAAFYILNSSNNTFRQESFGQTGDNPAIVGDYDGDGKADPAVYRAATQSNFYYRGSLNNPSGNISGISWGTNGDKPVSGDYNGDGKQDFAVFRNGTWWILQTGSSTYQVRNWGLSTDKLVPADYDGDGKTDLAVFRPSNQTWYIQNSSNGSIIYQTWGLATDVLVPADYDGDGKSDVAVYRNGIWYVLQSTNGSVKVENFGTATDIPIPATTLTP